MHRVYHRTSSTCQFVNVSILLENAVVSSSGYNHSLPSSLKPIPTIIIKLNFSHRRMHAARSWLWLGCAVSWKNESIGKRGIVAFGSAGNFLASLKAIWLVQYHWYRIGAWCGGAICGKNGCTVGGCAMPCRWLAMAASRWQWGAVKPTRHDWFVAVLCVPNHGRNNMWSFGYQSRVYVSNVMPVRFERCQCTSTSLRTVEQVQKQYSLQRLSSSFHWMQWIHSTSFADECGAAAVRHIEEPLARPLRSLSPIPVGQNHWRFGDRVYYNAKLRQVCSWRIQNCVRTVLICRFSKLTTLSLSIIIRKGDSSDAWLWADQQHCGFLTKTYGDRFAPSREMCDGIIPLKRSNRTGRYVDMESLFSFAYVVLAWAVQGGKVNTVHVASVNVSQSLLDVWKKHINI
jgi:hypothetical protein